MGTCEGLAETPQTSLWAEGNEGLPWEVSVTKKTQSRSTQPQSHASHAETPVAAHTTLRVASVVPLWAGMRRAPWHACGGAASGGRPAETEWAGGQEKVVRGHRELHLLGPGGWCCLVMGAHSRRTAGMNE